MKDSDGVKPRGRNPKLSCQMKDQIKYVDGPVQGAVFKHN
jgi:hypothetical protein